MLKHGTDWGTGPHAYASWRRKSVFGLFPTVTKLEILSKNVGRAFSSAWGVNFKTPKNFRPFFIVSAHQPLPHNHHNIDDSCANMSRM